MSFYRRSQSWVIGIACAIVLWSTFSTANAAATPTQGVPAAGGPSSSVMLTSQTGSIALGIYQPQKDTSGKAIDAYTKAAGKKPAFAWQPTTWQRPDGSYVQFDPQVLEEYRTRGIMPGMNWDASKGKPFNNTNQPDFSWKAIISGKHDAYIQQVAAAAAAYHYPFLMRVFEEMTGNWFPWGGNVNGNTNPADFVTAWKHIVDIFRKAGATNVQFVYCQNSLQASQINRSRGILNQLYPGDAYVDWIALDGYSNSSDNWRSLKDEFQPSYDLLTSLSTRPMIFYEVGAAEKPNDPMFKANWITQGFLTTIPQQFPKVKVANWFNGMNSRGDTNYALNTSQNAENAWKQVVASPLYQASFPQ